MMQQKAVKYCGKCGAPMALIGDKVQCRMCGHSESIIRQTETFTEHACPRCQEQISNDDTYCPYCCQYQRSMPNAAGHATLEASTASTAESQLSA